MPHCGAPQHGSEVNAFCGVCLGKPEGWRYQYPEKITITDDGTDLEKLACIWTTILDIEVTSEQVLKCLKAKELV